MNKQTKTIELMDKLKRVWCAWYGHPHIVSVCKSQVTCARCGAILGDIYSSLSVDVYSLKGDVIVEHTNCGDCHENYAHLHWHEKVFCPKPENE